MTLLNSEAPHANAGGLPTDDTALLLHYLKTHDAVCPLCKYNLRNLTVPRCPECGREIRLAVGLVEQVLWPYVMLLIGFLAPAGLGLLVLMRRRFLRAGVATQKVWGIGAVILAVMLYGFYMVAVYFDH